MLRKPNSILYGYVQVRPNSISRGYYYNTLQNGCIILYYCFFFPTAVFYCYRENVSKNVFLTARRKALGLGTFVLFIRINIILFGNCLLLFFSDRRQTVTGGRRRGVCQNILLRAVNPLNIGQSRSLEFCSLYEHAQPTAKRISQTVVRIRFREKKNSNGINIPNGRTAH